MSLCSFSSHIYIDIYCLLYAVPSTSVARQKINICTWGVRTLISLLFPLSDVVQGVSVSMRNFFYFDVPAIFVHFRVRTLLSNCVNRFFTHPVQWMRYDPTNLCRAVFVRAVQSFLFDFHAGPPSNRWPLDAPIAACDYPCDRSCDIMRESIYSLRTVRDTTSAHTAVPRGTPAQQDSSVNCT